MAYYVNSLAPKVFTYCLDTWPSWDGFFKRRKPFSGAAHMKAGNMLG